MTGKHRNNGEDRNHRKRKKDEKNDGKTMNLSLVTASQGGSWVVIQTLRSGAARDVFPEEPLKSVEVR